MRANSQHALHIKSLKLYCYCCSVLFTLSVLNVSNILDREKRSVIRFLTTRNVSAADIYVQISELYGPIAMSDSKVSK